MRKTWFLTAAMLALVAALLLGCSSPPPTPTQAPPPTARPAAPTAAPAAPAPTAKPAAPTAAPAAAAKPAQVPTWRAAAAKEGTTGYAAAVVLARMVDKYVPEIKMTAMPTPGSERSFYMVENGELELSYSGATTLKQAWDGSGVFKDQPVKFKTPRGVGAYGGALYFAKLPSNTGIKSLRDFAGKKASFLYPGSAGWAEMEQVFGPNGFKILDKIDRMNIDLSLVGEALASGKVDVVLGYTLGGSVPAYWTDLETRVNNYELVPATKEEMDTIVKLGSFHATDLYSKVPPDLFRVKQKATSILSIGEFPMSWNFAPDLPEDLVYKVTRAWFEHKDEMKSMGAMFNEFYMDPFAIQKTAIDIMPGVPTHPGVAKYYREKGQWNDQWKIAPAQQRAK